MSLCETKVVKIFVTTIALIAMTATGIRAAEGESGALDGQILLGQIERREAALPGPPKYYFDTNTSDTTVATLWMVLVDQWTDDGSLRKQHDNFYAAASLYRANAQIALIHARRHVENGKLEDAANAIDYFDRSITQFYYASQGAFASWDGNLDRARLLAEDIYRASKAMALQLSYILGPDATGIVDGLFTLADANITYSESGASTAAEDIVVKLAVEAMFRFGRLDGLGGQSMADSIEHGAHAFTGQPGIYEIFAQVTKDPEVRVQLMRAVANSTSENLKALTKSQIVKLVDAVLDASGTGSSEIPIVSYFRGRVITAEPTGRVPGGVTAGDLVAVEIIYDLTPDNIFRFDEQGADGYAFDTNRNSNSFKVTIGDNTWVDSGGFEILIFANLRDGSRRPYDYIRFATFKMRGPRTIDSTNAQFFLGSHSIHNLNSGAELPTSLADFDFTSEDDPKCCFTGIMEGETGQLGDEDYFHWNIGIEIDRSTFELGPAAPYR
jgi:hypothetical protein